MTTVRRGLFCWGIALILVLFVSSAASAEVRVDVNGKVLVGGIVENGRSFLEMRFFAETLGAAVAWHHESKTVYITQGETVVSFTQGQAKYFVNGEVRVIDAAPINVGGRLFVPLRAAAESLGYLVAYDQEAKTVSLKKEEAVLSAELDWKVLFGNDVAFALTVKNTGNVPVDVTLPGGQDFDMVVKQDGKEVYRWSDGKFFTLALRFVTYAPGEEKQFTWEWLPPAAGTYEVEVYYLGISVNEPVVRKTLVVDWEPSA